MTTAVPPTFVLLGAAGFVAPRHLSSIRAVGGSLLCACDPHDSVGILDRYFPRAHYVRTESELLSWWRRQPRPVDYLSICTPNDFHAQHATLALRNGSSAICEKPLVLSPDDLLRFRELEAVTGARVHPVLQLRVHPDLIQLKAELQSCPKARHEVDVTYVTARGPWYHASWKGREERSGGLVFAIGIHFIDLLLWLFGPVKRTQLFLRSNQRIAGELELERATARFLLSIDESDLPESSWAERKSTFRSLQVDGSAVEFSSQFDSLHHEVYRRICSGRGLTAEDAAPAVHLAHALRIAPLSPRVPRWLGRKAS
jgi:UDP-N-acetyl-2-amino-2-deoxyglucuronate dehydrogenase